MPVPLGILEAGSKVARRRGDVRLRQAAVLCDDVILVGSAEPDVRLRIGLLGLDAAHRRTRGEEDHVHRDAGRLRELVEEVLRILLVHAGVDHQFLRERRAAEERERQKRRNRDAHQFSVPFHSSNPSRIRV